jgi:hypothetical protein
VIQRIKIQLLSTEKGCDQWNNNISYTLNYFFIMFLLLF